METFYQVLNAAVPVYLLITVGVAVRLAGVLTAEADASILRLLINLLMPSLILVSLIGNEFASDPVNLIAGPLLGYGTVAVGIGGAWVAGRLLGLPELPQRAFALAVGLYNYGYIPLPLVLALFGPESLGVLFLFNTGTELAIWTLGIMVLRGGHWRDGWRRIQPAPVLAVIVGVGINLLGLSAAVPGVLLSGLGMLGGCAIPLGILLVGATACDLRGDIRLAGRGREVGTALLVRMVLLPAVFLLLALLPGLTPALRDILVIQAAMPSAMLPIILIKMEKGDVPLALTIVIASSVLSFFTIPFVIKLGLWLTGGSDSPA
ncbi:MAG: AEC family transporter [Verrucomicrobiota bacterium]